MRIAAGFALGTLPGLALMLLVDPRIGLALCVLGAFIGTALALPGVSIQRVLLALLGIVIDRTAPMLTHVVDLDAADARIPVKNDDLSFRLFKWLLVPTQRNNRRGWLVLGGVITGGLIGLGFGSYDVWQWYHDRPGLFLPWGELEEDADIFAEAFIIFAAGIVWGGSLMALIASSPWRRSILFGAGIGTFFSGIVQLAASKPGEFSWRFVVPFATIGAAFALFFFPLVSMEHFTDDT